MRYHIHTAPVWDAYKLDGCPLCAIKQAKEKRLISQYLSDNVMDPEFRQRSNAHGFCPEHIRALYAGENKLGLGLQMETRAEALEQMITPPKDKKAAKALAQRLDNANDCVICSALNELMPRYYRVVAEMYENEAEFPPLFGTSHHCFFHAIELLKYSEYAGKKFTPYTAALTEGLKRDLNAAKSSLRDFADCFDYRNSARPDPDALPRAIALLITPKLK